MSGREPYPPPPAWKWPEPGVRTWEPPEASFFGSCTGQDDCEIGRGCPVGEPLTISGPAYGCDCPCHEEQRAVKVAR